ncbi:MAG: hypothetical protein B5766_11145 [Candidatus Lumbricidophila eiseniae]|uniref:Peptidoglycan binding-like domain-containing protein n=1 Tax=Candidatus Lumbricidiphila eiseniae TaxID=1969409 RepID=A0A2A6FPF3_9MICO|nr:MAG: hypothetical protein B5766_11145 [Candidatus Lumbricidophila eiseniae]
MGNKTRRSSDGDSDEETGRASVRGRRVVVVVLASALVLTAGGWVASTFMKTPADVVAEAKPPVPSVITAKVTKRVVSNQVVTRGTVSSTQLTNVLDARQAVGASITVVTGDPLSVGDEIKNGDVIVQLSGRPVIALRGAFPAYRDLAEGMTGHDVTQLQEALHALGFYDGKDPARTFGPRTTAAVIALYESKGYKNQATVPVSEVFFISSFPARIESGSITVGALASRSTLNVATGAPSVRVNADPQILAVAKPGVVVKIVSESIDQTTTGKVAGNQTTTPSGNQTAAPGGNQSGGSGNQSGGSGSQSGASGGNRSGGSGDGVGGSGGRGVQVVDITPDALLSAEWVGQDVRVTFVDGSSEGEVLAVPVSAVSQRGDGATVVTVVTGVGKDMIQTTVEVKTGVMGGGYIEVSPLGGGVLSPGDDVLIGTP